MKTQQFKTLSIKDFLTELTDELVKDSITQMDCSESNFEEFGCKPDDVIIYFDFCSDDDNPKSSKVSADEMLDMGIEAVNEYMTLNGYVVAVENFDGCGNGLYYGFLAYRK